MTPEEFTQRLPPLSNNPLPAKPPFVFNGLSSRVLPLRANLDALQRFVNGYLNFVPESVGRFRASTPYVFLSVLDYGSVSESAGLGWFSQTEVFFAVALDWYRKVDGRWVFHDWATITPFIYVDDNFSVPLGRTVSGFPKVLSRVTQVSSEWVRNPMAPLTLARIETEVFPAAYAGKRLENRVFLEVLRDAPMSNLRMPADPRSPLAPWTVAANLADAAGGFGRDALWLAQALRIFAQVPAGQMPGMLPEMLARLAPALQPGGTGLVMNSLNLKQFRRADKPDELCYQALTNGPMITSAFNQGGLLGEERTLLGDLSGGHTIRLHEYPALPIVKTLGLEVQRRWQGDGVMVAELKPVLPMWMDVNVSLQPSVNLAWRGQEGGWRDGSGAPMPADARPGSAPASVAPPPRFNTALASAVESISGPFEFTGTTIRVLPLLARLDKLQTFLDRWMNDALSDPVLDDKGISEHVRMRVWARPPVTVSAAEQNLGGDLAYVYLTATHFDQVSSGTNNVGDWAEFELAFLVPVCWQRRVGPAEDDHWVTEGVGVVPAYFFVDDCMAAISRHEVQGIDARTANFVRPRSVWASEGADQHKPRQSLLRVDTEVWAALETGQQAQVRPVVEIVQNDANAGLGNLDTRNTAQAWSQQLRRELRSKKATQRNHPLQAQVARSMALELLGNQAPLAMYSLKQFRDAVDPDRACCQALLRVPRRLKEVFDLSEIEATLSVHLHDFPKLAIVDSLGLLATRMPGKGAGISYSAQAVRPFSIRATLVEPLAQPLMSRAGSSIWRLTEHAFGGSLGHAARAPAWPVTTTAETLQDRTDPSRMFALTFNARRARAVAAVAIDVQRARDALAMIDAQMVIESVLSREWGSTSDTARWRQGRRELEAASQALPQGAEIKAAAQAALYGAILAARAERQGFPEKLKDFAERVIKRQLAFEAARADLEKCFDSIAPWLQADAPGRLEGAAKAKFADLLKGLGNITKLHVEGEPSADNNLNVQVLGYRERLKELLSQAPLKGLHGQPAELTAAALLAAAQPLRQAVVAARKYCSAQDEALLNTLSRAWQKPDFCIRRDAVGPERDRLLTATGSWDDEWYFGGLLAQQASAAASTPKAGS